MVRVHKKNSQQLYEENFSRIRMLLADLQFFEHITLSSDNHSVCICADVLERTPYTMLIDLVSHYSRKSEHLPETKLQVRMYYDAKVAEVLKIQGHQRIQPFYQYPNENMYAPDEKKQGNRLLAELLNFCIRNNYKKSYFSQPIAINN